jgi:hypothetical protein
LVNSLAALSLLLCVSASLCWVGSRFRAGWFSVERERDNKNQITEFVTQINAARDGINWFLNVMFSRDPEQIQDYHESTQGWIFHGDVGDAGDLFSPFIRRTHSGFAFYHRLDNSPVTRDWLFELRAPYWFLIFFFALFPGWILARRRYRRTIDPTLCAICGYDLRMTPACCPECGTSPRVVK